MNNAERLNEIIAGCQRGSNKAYSQLVDIYATRCYGYFYRLSGNRSISNDLLSELFLRLVEKVGQFTGGSFEKWLFTIASNIFHDYLRNKYRQKKLLDGKISELKYQSSNRVLDDVIDDKLQKSLAELDADTAELIVLRFYAGLSFKELAAVRSEPIGTTLSKVHRGLKKLRNLMGDI